ncbi:hypothetical protein U1Q18_013570 [Sarracenia purpurea var. burkii]
MVPQRKRGRRWSAPLRSDGVRLFDPLMRDSPRQGTATYGGRVEEDRWPPQANRTVRTHPPQRRFQIRGLSFRLYSREDDQTVSVISKQCPSRQKEKGV